MVELPLKAEVPDVAFKTGRFSINVEVLHDPFPDEYYRHFKIKKSNEVRYRHFDDMVEVSCSLPKNRDNMQAASRYASAREYYRSKLGRKHPLIMRKKILIPPDVMRKFEQIESRIRAVVPNKVLRTSRRKHGR